MHGAVHKKTETIIHKILHFLEVVIAILTLLVLIGMVGLEVYKMFTVCKNAHRQAPCQHLGSAHRGDLPASHFEPR